MIKAPKETLKVTNDTIINQIIKWLVYNPWTFTVLVSTLIIMLPAILTLIFNIKTDCGCDDGPSFAVPMVISLILGLVIFIVNIVIFKKITDSYLTYKDWYGATMKSDVMKEYEKKLTIQICNENQ